MHASSMKLATDSNSTTAREQYEIHLPFGLIGLPDLSRFDLTPVENSWPFLSMRSLGEEPFNFIVIDPSGLIPGYEIELSDDDAETLRITSGDEALILNIVTVHASRPQFVTVNLVGPIVVNRRTWLGKQVIVSNWNQFSTKHPLIDERVKNGVFEF